MDRTKLVSAVAVIVAAAGGAFADPVLVADSVAEFSGTQGQNGWHYGWYNLEDISVGGSSVSVSTGDFRQFGFYDAGTGWWATDPTSAGGDPSGGATPGSYAVVTERLMHPNAALPQANIVADEQWAARRWVSDIDGTVSLDGIVRHYDYGFPIVGNGTVAHILVDGVSVYSFDVGLNDIVGDAFAFDVAVAQGTVIDFVVGADGNPLFDATEFTVRMTANVIPGPASLALLGLGGIMSGRRRR